MFAIKLCCFDQIDDSILGNDGHVKFNGKLIVKLSMSLVVLFSTFGISYVDSINLVVTDCTKRETSLYFDGVYNGASAWDRIMDDMKPYLNAFSCGKPICVFTYGVTGIYRCVLLKNNLYFNIFLYFFISR